MPELSEVTEGLKDTIQAITKKCWNCNFCISVCPVFASTHGIL